MDENEQIIPIKHDDLAGSYVETAFTSDEVERAIAEERRRGIQNASCAFIGDIANRE